MTGSATVRGLRAIIGVGLVVAAQSAFAATDYYWDTSTSPPLQGGSGTWSTVDANWTTDPSGSGSVVPWSNENPFGANADFTAAPGGAITVSGSISTSLLAVSSPGAGYTFSGGTLNISAIYISNNSNASIASAIVQPQSLETDAGSRLTVSGPILTPQYGISVQGAGTTTISGNLSGNGALQMNGPGTLTLAGTNSHSGGTTVSGGALSIASTAALPGWSIAGSYSVAAGATLAVSNAISDANIGTMLATGNFAAGASIGFDTTTASRTSSTTWGDTTNGPLGLTVLGGNTLTLSGSNTYSGGTSVMGGTLQLSSANALGASGGSLGINGGTLDLGGYSPTVGAVTLVNGSIVSSGVSSATLSGTGGYIVQNGAISVNLAGGNAALTKSTAGTVLLSGTNSYSGGTTVSGGVLSIATTAALPGWSIAGSYSVAPGATLAVSNAVSDANIGVMLTTGNFASGASFGFDTTTGSRTSSTAWGDTANGPLGLTVLGGNTLTLSGSNSYSGGTTVMGGTLQVGNTNALGSGGLTVNNGAVDLAGYSIAIPSLAGTAGAITNSSATQATLTVSPTATSNFGGTLQDGSGTLALVANGPGTLILSGSNTYSGTTWINGGVLSLANSAALAGRTPITFAGGTLQFTGSNAVDYSGRIVNSTTPISIDTNGQNVTFGGTLASSNSGGLTVTSTAPGGILILSGSNTYTGGTTVGSGVLEAATTAALPGYSTPGKVSVMAGATLAVGVGGAGQWQAGDIDTLRGVPGTFAGGASLGIDTSGGSFVYPSNITDTGAGPLGLVKLGSDALTLSGSNTYSGTTSINAGVLRLANSAALAGSTAISFAGGTLQFTASNTVDYSGRIVNSTGAIAIDSNGQSVTFGSPLADSNTGGLIVSSTTPGGVLLLSGNNSYGGGTTISSGTLALSGVGTLGATSGNLTLSGGMVDLGGTSQTVGEVYITSPASGNTIQNGTLTGNYNVSNGSGNVALAANLQGSSLSKLGTGMLTLSGSNSIDVTVDGGSLQMPSGSLSSPYLYVGSTGTGTFTQTGGTNTVSYELYLGGDSLLGSGVGTYRLCGGGLSAPNEYIADGNSSAPSNFVQSGGTNTVSSGLYLGGDQYGNYGVGAYRLCGGSLSATSELIGASSTSSTYSAPSIGSFIQSGGTNLAASSLYLGFNIGSSGSYGLCGSGLLSANSEYVGYSGSGSFTQSRGINAVGSLALGQSAGSSGTYNLNGGLMLVGSGGVANGAGATTFNFGGGTLGATAPWSSSLNMILTASGGNSTVDTTGGNITLSGALGGPGGLTKAGNGALTLSNSGNSYAGGTNVLQGLVVIAPGSFALPYGPLFLSGGSLDLEGNGTVVSTLGGNGTIGNGALGVANSATLYVEAGGNFSGTIRDGGFGGSAATALLVAGGTLVLSGSNTYSGGTTVYSGVLEAATTAALPGYATPGNVSAAAGATLAVSVGGAGQWLPGDIDTLRGVPGTFAAGASLGIDTSGGSFAYPSNITDTGAGPLGLVKLGSNTLTLSGSNTYSGGTQVNAGTLRIGPAGSIAAASPISVISGAALAVTASTNLPGNTITIQPGGLFDTSGGSGFSLGSGNLLTIGRPGGGGTDLNGNLTLAGGTIDIGGTAGTMYPWSAATLTESGNLTLAGGAVKFDLSSTGASDLASVASLNLTSTTTFAFNFTGGSLADGSYPLIDYSGSLTGSATALKTAVAHVVRQSFTLVASGTSDGVLSLVVAGAPANLIWTGSQSNGWDTATLNWNNGGTADKFYNNDAVTFNDTAAVSTSGAVTIDADVFPGSVRFNNNTLNYKLSGSGGVGGTGGLTKDGSGTVTLAGSNSFSGATAINQGTVQLANANALPNSTVSVNGSGGLTFSPGVGTFNLGGLAGGGNFALSDTAGAAVTLNVGGNNASSTFFGGMSGSGSLIKTGSGTLTVAGSNTYTGGTTIAAGTLQIGTVQIGSGTSGSISGNITNNAALVFARADNAAFSGAVSGTGGLTQAGTGTLTLSGSSSYSGGTTIAAGTLKLDFSQAGAPAANIINNLANVSTLTLAGGTLSIQGNTSAANSQSFNGLVVNPGSSAIVVTAAGTANSVLLSLGSITNAGGQVDFTLPSGTQSATNGITTTTPNDAAGILGSYATVGGGADWACVTGTAGNITAYNGYTGGDLGQIPSNGALNVSPSGPQTAVVIAKQFNTLQLSGTVGVTMAGSGSLTLLDGGLIADTSGTMGGGTLAGSVGGALTVVTPANITIGSIIADDGGATALVKAGTGILTLTGNNTYSGGTTISVGTLAVSSAASLGAPGGGLSIGPTTLEVEGNYADGRNIALTAPGSTVQVDPAFTYGNSGTLSGAGGLTLSGGGTLILGGSGDYTGGTFVDDGTLVVTSPEALADGSSLTVGNVSLFAPLTPDLAAGSITLSSVPEPSTLALLAAAAALMAMYRRRR